MITRWFRTVKTLNPGRINRGRFNSLYLSAFACHVVNTYYFLGRPCIVPGPPRHPVEMRLGHARGNDGRR